MASITWTATNGQTIEVKARGHGQYVARMAGKVIAEGGITTPREMPAAARAAGIVAFVAGKVGLTAERRDALVAFDKTITAERDAAYAPVAELERLEGALANARERLTRDGYGDTGARGMDVEDAAAALMAYKTAHADVWERVRTERAAEAARKQAELDQSFIARGLD